MGPYSELTLLPASTTYSLKRDSIHCDRVIQIMKQALYHQATTAGWFQKICLGSFQGLMITFIGFGVVMGSFSFRKRKQNPPVPKMEKFLQKYVVNSICTDTVKS